MWTWLGRGEYSGRVVIRSFHGRPGLSMVTAYRDNHPHSGRYYLWPIGSPWQPLQNINDRRIELENMRDLRG